MIAAFEIVSSTRRSTRARPPAISSTARCRSSIRPRRETAKSTMSARPPASRSFCAARTRLTFTQAYSAAASAATATTAAPTAIAAATVAETCMSLTLPEREDDRVARRVVVGLGLARHRRDVDLERRLLRERHLAEVAEVDGLRLAGVDHLDRLRLHDRRAGLLDRERDLDADLL